MAKRRMLLISIVESDKFYEMRPITQALYIHLCLKADDDGIVDSVRSVMRNLKAPITSYKRLVEDNYLTELDRGLIAITHWHLHNQIRKDRYVETVYRDAKKELMRDDNNRYFKASEDSLVDKCVPQYSVVKDSTVQVSTGEVSEVYVSTDERSEEKNNFSLIHTHTPTQSVSVEGDSERISRNNYDNKVYDMKALKTAIALYFMKKYKSTKIDNFVAYCESLNWVSEDGESIKENHKKYIDRWMLEDWGQ